MVDEPDDIDAVKNPDTPEGEDASEDAPSKPPFLKVFFQETIKPRLVDVTGDFKENFKPQSLTTILAFILFCVPMGLGIWQVQRLEWKTNLIAEIERQQDEAPLEIITSNPFQDWKNLEYRKASITGDYVFIHSIEMRPRTLEGRAGYHLLTPLRLSDDKMVIINRGWVPEGTRITEEYWNAEGVTITGTLRTPEKPNMFTPDNNPKNDEWYWADLSLIAQEIGVKNVEPMILYQDAQNTDITEKTGVQTYPVGGQANLTLRNTHKMYAVTWFLMAFSFLIMWFFYSWKSPEVLTAPTEEGDTAPRDNIPEDDL